MRGFDRALKITLAFEGGWSDDPHDPGGQTMRGVTQRVFDAFLRNRGEACRSVRGITDQELDAIYRKQYWQAAGCDDYSWPLNLAVFDYAVNSGVRRAIKTLQQLVGVHIDGFPGLKTSGAASHEPRALAQKLIEARKLYLRSIAKQARLQKFLPGWMRRCEQLAKKCEAT